ncbi:ABC transporter ATP-binding protein [Legionella sp. CNM-4043-24]|uniref:ABC transporter ATP-binding protein n=1 Tax=Legionella sp. CNM-4043-24 TaxID=3421646 RepID=UPI00403B057B
MATVTIDKVSKDYGQQRILDSVSLSIERGEFVAVVGPSGCGKSTLLRLVSGLDDVSAGKILINGECVNKTPAHKRDMAMVFQSYALYPHMSVFDNMAYGLKMRGMAAPDIHKRVTEAAAMLRLSDYLERKPQALSGGQRQRVAMGRAIVRSPSVFLFDEPLSNLDTSLRTEMRHEIKKLHQQLQTTCLYVTHDQTEAMTMASRVLVLNQGRVEQIGSPQHLYQEPASMFVAAFTGIYPINFIPATLNNREIVSDAGCVLPAPEWLLSNSSNTAVMLGVRPEHWILTEDRVTNSIPVSLEFVDDLGADKLLHLLSQTGRHRFCVRISADTPLPESGMAVKPVLDKVSIFHPETGLRLGGWA